MPQMNVYPKTTHKLLSADLAANKIVTIAVALNIPVAEYREATLILRVHEYTGTIAPAGSDVSAALYNSAPSREDPAKVFRGATALGSATIAYTGTTFPAMATYTQTTQIGEAFDILLNLRQATPTATDVTVTISMDLVLKTG